MNKSPVIKAKSKVLITSESQFYFDMRVCPDVHVQCMCALIGELGLAFWSCALLVGVCVLSRCDL